ncbi:MAG TPA: CRISPR-associated protein Csx20 [Deltaproteobacteria bacterium]|nr:CRISPR-associated protein Csx20 [Deltaproteobacteria bacterium]HQI79969.1 CRISPR-associated protein Csx20 [Deltaproteobacteria bacterium]
MRRMFLFFSHTLTREQEEDARATLMVDEFVYLPAGLQGAWSAFDPGAGTIDGQLEALRRYVDENCGPEDVCLVHGDSGAVFSLVSHLRERGFKAYYSTTRRVFEGETMPEGTARNSHLFRHVRFREYE